MQPSPFDSYQSMVDTMTSTASIMLDEEQTDFLLSLLETPPAPNEKLVKAAAALPPQQD